MQRLICFSISCQIPHRVKISFFANIGSIQQSPRISKNPALRVMVNHWSVNDHTKLEINFGYLAMEVAIHFSEWVDHLIAVLKEYH